MRKRIYLLMMMFWLGAALTAAQNGQTLNQSILRPLPLLSPILLAENDRPPAIDMDDNAKALDLDLIQPGKKVSMTKAVGLSLLIPGAGEYYAGAKFKGQVFMGVEAAIWTGFVAYRVYGGWKEDDYQSYASAYAGVDNSGKDEDFYDLVGFYDSREEANQLGMLYNTDREYLPDTPAFDWQWATEEERLYFREMKEDSDIAYRNSNWMLALAVLNRLVSGFDTYRTVRSVNRKASSLTQLGAYKFKFSSQFWGGNPSCTVKLIKKF